MDNLYTDKSFALSQTAIKEWDNLPPNIWYDMWILGKRKSKVSRTMDMGSLLDTLCFNPELFDKRFIVADCKKPSPKVEEILLATYEHLTTLNKNIKELNEKNDTKVPLKKITLVGNEDVLRKFSKELDYYTNAPDTAITKITVKEGTDYFAFIKKLGKKISITPEQHKLALELKEILFTDKATKGFFTAKKGTRLIFQLQIRAQFPISGVAGVEAVPVKGILDILLINDIKKTVREIDLKFTEMGVYQFNKPKGPVRQLDYPLQHSFYDFLISEWIKTFEDGKYEGYTIEAPLNVTIDDTIKIPYIYKYNREDMAIKRSGIEGTWIKGWENTLQDIAWHINLNDFSRPREHIMNGAIAINVFKK
jgi:hypothetical protein